MSRVSRETTLDEYVADLPEYYAACREFIALKAEVARLKGEVERKDKCLCNAMAIVKQAQACMTHNTYPACHCWPCQVERALLPALAPAPEKEAGK